MLVIKRKERRALISESNQPTTNKTLLFTNLESIEALLDSEGLTEPDLGEVFRPALTISERGVNGRR
jgi:hypothetical protein